MTLVFENVTFDFDLVYNITYIKPDIIFIF